MLSSWFDVRMKGWFSWSTFNQMYNIFAVMYLNQIIGLVLEIVACHGMPMKEKGEKYVFVNPQWNSLQMQLISWSRETNHNISKNSNRPSPLPHPPPKKKERKTYSYLFQGKTIDIEKSLFSQWLRLGQCPKMDQFPTLAGETKDPYLYWNLWRNDTLFCEE